MTDSRLSAFVRVLIPFGIVFAFVAGWWYLLNLLLYGELTGTATMIRIFGARATPLTAMQLLTQLREVWETFWVGFGWGNIRANPAIYLLLEVVMVMSGIGLLLGFVRRRDRFHPTLVKAMPFFALAFWIVFAFFELVNWMEITQAPHGRLFFPALPALAPLAIFGLTQWAQKRAQPPLARSIAIAFFALALFAPFAILQPAYAYPAPLTANEAQNLAHRVDINFDGKLMLLGYDLSSPRAQPGESVTLTLDWQALAAMDEDYSIGIHLLDANQRVIGARDSYPGHGMLPTRLWRPGQMIRDTYWVPIAPDATAPTVARFQVTLYVRETKRDLPAFDPQGQAITPLVGALKIALPNHFEPRPQHATGYTFGGKIALLGYDLQAGSAPQMTLYWKRVAPVAEDYTVFVHVLDANGKIVAQKDQQPDSGANPTSLWEEGEVALDHYAFILPADTRGALRIAIGLYRADSGERLQVFDGTGSALGDHLELTTIEVSN